MVEKMPVVSGNDLIDFFVKLGCEVKRVKGSHYVLKSHLNNRMFVVPVHGNEDIDRGTLRVILQQAGLSNSEFIRLWNE